MQGEGVCVRKAFLKAPFKLRTSHRHCLVISSKSKLGSPYVPAAPRKLDRESGPEALGRGQAPGWGVRPGSTGAER